MRIYKALLPASWLYGIGVGARNLFFDCGLLKSRSFDIPVICVGNLAVGGTGKTPHVEHITRLLKDQHRLAVLSRGYKRRTKGFVLAGNDSTALDIGDEPMQIHSKYDDITVAVDENRCEGIERLMALGTEVVVLDDAFQHRYVKPSLSILLIEHSRLHGDQLLPAGRLREPLSGIRRADIVVVTKCPTPMKEEDYEKAAKSFHLSPRQHLFFSRMEYMGLEPVFRNGKDVPHVINQDTNVLIVSGIANPSPMEDEIRKHTTHIQHLAYGDHHAFSDNDIADINTAFTQLPTPKLVVTTEKDAARLRTTQGLSREVMEHTCQLPIKVKILKEEGGTFDHLIINHVSTQ